MIVVRFIFQAKWGKGGELADGMKESLPSLTSVFGHNTWRVYTDLSGEFNTVVLEVEHESLAAAEQFRTEMFANAAWRASVARTDDLIASGRQEFYTIEAESGR